MKNSFEQIYEVVRKIPMGRVATYGQIAALAGNPRWTSIPSRASFPATGWSTASANLLRPLRSVGSTGRS